jgi:hypothetical protein
MKKKAVKAQQTPPPKDETYRDEHGWPMVGTRAHHERLGKDLEIIMKENPNFPELSEDTGNKKIRIWKILG